MSRAHIVIVGGGISGLSAALRLTDDELDLDVTVLEKSASIGGKLMLHQVEGMTLDAGAESVLARRAEGTELIRIAGLQEARVSPAVAGAGIWVNGTWRQLPRRQLLGIPLSAADAADGGVLDSAGVLRLTDDLALPRTNIDTDLSVGSLVRQRLGSQVVDRLVEPLLGGVYAGQADGLSLDMVIPGLLGELETHSSLMSAAASLVDRSEVNGPVFASLAGGLGQLPDAVARASSATIRCGMEARTLRPEGKRLAIAVRTAGGTDGELDADAVILACDGPSAGALVQDICPTAGSELSGLEYASVALVTYVFDTSAHGAWPSGTGFLVPPSEGFTIKAATFMTQKWAWIRERLPGSVVVRASVGRFGDDSVLALDDEELAARVLKDLSTLTGVVDTPRTSVVSRWPCSLPQYRPGHRARVAQARTALAAQGLVELCGAAVDGVGVPACIASGQQAATRVANLLCEAGE